MSRKFLLVLASLSLVTSGNAQAREYGPCEFDSETLRFAGTAKETAACLLRKVRPRGAGADEQPLPYWLADRILKPVPITLEQLRAYLAAEGIEQTALSPDLAYGDSPGLRYFVIHDTSSPEIPSESREFPAFINDASYSGNRLSGWGETDQRVNLLINRAGQSRAMTPWGDARPLAATKLERTSTVPKARALFVHVENIQPRIKPPGSWAWVAPRPGLAQPQEKRLALAYVVASMHAGRWLIPAYHFNIDQGFADVHDDPQNMDLASWVSQIEKIESELRQD